MTEAHNDTSTPVCPDCGDWAHDGPVDKCEACDGDVPCSVPVVLLDSNTDPVKIRHLECPS